MKHIKTVNSFISDHTIVEFELFTLCDKSCSYCYNVIDTNGRRFNSPIEKVLEGLQRIMSMDNKKVIIQLIGGEVMLHKNFEDIVNFIYDNCDPAHKLTVFTHADHPEDFFKSRIDLLKKFGDRVRVSCTLHFEDLNQTRFLNNLRYVDQTFDYSNLFFFTDNQYLKDIDFVEQAIEATTKMTLFPIALDQSTDYMRTQQVVNMNSRFDKYLHRMDTQYEIDGVRVPYNKGKYQIFRDNKLTFTNGTCTIRAYEVDRLGNLTMACFAPWQKPIANIFNNTKTDLINQCDITCPQTHCQFNLVSLEVKLDK